MGLFIPVHSTIVLAPPKAGSAFILESLRNSLRAEGIPYLRHDDACFIDKSPHRNLYGWLQRLQQIHSVAARAIICVRNPFRRLESLFNFAMLDSLGYP